MTKPPILRISLNFYMPAENSMKIIEGGTYWFNDISALRDKYGLDNFLFEVQRRGDKGNTKTRYVILPDAQINDELRSTIQNTPLHDLEKIAAGNSQNNTGNVLIESKVAEEFITRLRTLPRDYVKQFLTQFSISKVRELRASEEENARHLISRLEKEQHRPASDINPFAN